jgi:putative Holliday junction resolvase
MRVLGVDLGDRRIGLAISDPTGTVALGAGFLQVRSTRQALSALGAVVQERQIHEVVVGLPLTMSGQRGARAEKTERFVGQLRKMIHIPVSLWDERFTTEAARRVIRETGARERGRRGRTDEIAATILLQSWLDARRATARSGRSAPGARDGAKSLE